MITPDNLPRYNVEYSVGFAFNGLAVALIRKNLPAWRAGKLNGIGGHVEPGEHPHDCMTREFWEEAGVATERSDWELFAVMHGADWQKDPTGRTSTAVFCYETHLPEICASVQTKTDEEVEPFLLTDLFGTWRGAQLIPNLQTLIPLAFNRGVFQRPTEFLWLPSYEKSVTKPPLALAA